MTSALWHQLINSTMWLWYSLTAPGPYNINIAQRLYSGSHQGKQEKKDTICTTEHLSQFVGRFFFLLQPQLLCVLGSDRKKPAGRVACGVTEREWRVQWSVSTSASSRCLYMMRGMSLLWWFGHLVRKQSRGSGFKLQAGVLDVWRRCSGGTSPLRLQWLSGTRDIG